MKLIKKIAWKIFKFLKIDVFWLLATNSGLEKRGWLRSYYSKKSVDKWGNPLPWYTYPFLTFIEKRINNSMNIFEYGCGHSTLWYSKRVKDVISIEHDESWFNEISSKKEKNSTILFKKDPRDYVHSINNLDNSFDIIVIDAIERVDCIKNSFNKLRENGIIIFDNSDRSEYKEGYKFLRDKGFKRLDFWGMGPVNTYDWCTSVFYREKNCLNI